MFLPHVPLFASHAVFEGSGVFFVLLAAVFFRIFCSKNIDLISSCFGRIFLLLAAFFFENVSSK